MELWSEIRERLSEGQSLVMIVVTEIKGSSPGKPGFKMLVGQHGPITGSVGGGMMEYKLVQLAQQSLASGLNEVFEEKLTHSKEAGKQASGLICAGSQSQVFIPLGPDKKYLADAVLEAMDKNNPCELVITDKGLHVINQSLSSKKKAEGPDPSSVIFYRETLRPSDTVYIFGGGHISLPLSQVCRMTGFRVVILDDRPSLITMESNKYAHEKKQIDYVHAAEEILYPGSAYVCIMTVSHQSDKMILSQLLDLPLCYLGMIGSRNKIRQIFADLRNSGVSESTLSRVDTPMGLPIHAITPAEIAVSIAAKMIEVKNSPR